MPEMQDVLTKDTVHHLHSRFQEGVIVLQQLTAKSGAKELGITTKTFDRVAEPMLRYVHQQLMASSVQNNSTVLAEYPRISKTTVSTVLKTNHAGDVRLIGDVTRLLQYAGVARFNKKNASWYLRDWSYANVRYIGTQEWASIRPDPQADSRATEEADKPIHSSFNLKGFKAPDATREAIMEFVEKFIPAALAVQAERDAALLKVKELEGLLAAATIDEWQGIGSKIQDLLS